MLGPKALHLKQMKDAGFPIPAFHAFASSELEIGAKKMAERAIAAVPATRYAVRSAALAEDTAASSMAGQFHTELDVEAADLPKAIDLVLNDAHEKLGSLERFSLVVQDYIKADFSGVTFTRDPNGGRQTVIEFHRGSGDTLVGGEITPERIEWYRTEKPEGAFPAFTEACALFLEIEDLFGAPQDIEWCVKGGAWWIVQSRPITTRTPQDDQACEYLDQVLPVGTPFLWETTEISEIASRPNSLTLDVLRRIYGKDGPVQKTYASLGIVYEPRDFLRVVGGQLFVDREEELQSLLPAYSYLTKVRPGEPVPARGEGAWRSMKNAWKLGHWRMPSGEALLKRLRQADALELPATFAESLDRFMKDYELIFLINLCAQRELATRRALSTNTNQRPPNKTSLKGNSLDFGDETPFHGHGIDPAPEHPSYGWLREAARYLTVKHVDHIRTCAPQARPADTLGFVIHGPLTNLPARKQAQKTIGVSPGEATGTACAADEIRMHKDSILVTDLLTPDLAPLLPYVQGIVSRRGGTLSHLAIIAREQGIPVVVLGERTSLPATGTRLSINGTDGSIEVLPLDKAIKP